MFADVNRSIDFLYDITAASGCSEASIIDMRALSVGFATSRIVLDRVIGAEARKIVGSFVRFAPVQCIKRKQDPAGLAPQSCLIAVEAIERQIGQIGQTQKAASKLDCRGIVIDLRDRDRFYAISIIPRGCVGFGRIARP